MGVSVTDLGPGLGPRLCGGRCGRSMVETLAESPAGTSLCTSIANHQGARQAPLVRNPFDPSPDHCLCHQPRSFKQERPMSPTPAGCPAAMSPASVWKRGACRTQSRPAGMAIRRPDRTDRSSGQPTGPRSQHWSRPTRPNTWACVGAFSSSPTGWQPPAPAPPEAPQGLRKSFSASPHTGSHRDKCSSSSWPRPCTCLTSRRPCRTTDHETSSSPVRSTHWPQGSVGRLVLEVASVAPTVSAHRARKATRSSPLLRPLPLLVDTFAKRCRCSWPMCCFRSNRTDCTRSTHRPRFAHLYAHLSARCQPVQVSPSRPDRMT